MKAMRLKIYQETACYTKPFSRKVAETYPLPPYSVIKGMIHSVLHASKLIPFSLSIQGKYESKIIDYRKTYMVKSGAAMPIVLDGLSGEVPQYSSNQMTSMPLYTHMLYNVELLIHIAGENFVLQEIYNALSCLDQTLSIGRFEDLAKLVEEPSWVEVKEVDQVRIHDYSIYVPEEYIAEDRFLDGIPYQLNWTYKIVNGIRQWKKIPVVYVAPSRSFGSGRLLTHVYKDNDGYTVFWNV